MSFALKYEKRVKKKIKRNCTHSGLNHRPSTYQSFALLSRLLQNHEIAIFIRSLTFLLKDYLDSRQITPQKTGSVLKSTDGK